MGEGLTFRDGRCTGAAALFPESAGGDFAPDVFVRLEEDDVDLGRVETNESRGRAEAYGDAERRDLRLVCVASSEICRRER